MKQLLPLVAASVLSICVALPSCSDKPVETTAKSTLDSVAADSVVLETEIDMVMLSTAKSYAIEIDTSTYRLAISADLQWPKMIGKYNLKVLQDSITSFCFPESPKMPVKHAMLEFVSNTEGAGFDKGVKVTPIDKVFPDSVNSFSVELDGRILEFGEKTLTYQIVEFSFLGGAHPNTISRTFTYDLAKAKILSVSDIIAQNKLDDFKLAVFKQLATQLDMTPALLNETLLNPPFTLSEDIYCADGYIYVHYNPYELLPYSYGTLDVQLSPFEHSSLLTPYGRDLLIE